ncbi:hypothetical protein CUMW_265390 [Citrus unshiu]|uniref:Uncharacterized protein n=1 Tax=Citrus unshiu TaxID=55188 RepID=A0A2H5QVI2_CITUN|nr:hypothetical protein CUMW_265390 [Citrus unshiu]
MPLAEKKWKAGKKSRRNLPLATRKRRSFKAGEVQEEADDYISGNSDHIVRRLLLGELAKGTKAIIKRYQLLYMEDYVGRVF